MRRRLAGDTFVRHESVGLAFAKLVYPYKPQNLNDSLGAAVEFKFNRVANRAF